MGTKEQRQRREESKKRCYMSSEAFDYFLLSHAAVLAWCHRIDVAFRVFP